MSRPLVTFGDLMNLVRDGLAATRGEEFAAWLEKEGFEVEALVGLTRFLIDAWEASGEPPPVLALSAFTVGWDAHRHLRGEA